jgi:hypothetical protein
MLLPPAQSVAAPAAAEIPAWLSAHIDTEMSRGGFDDPTRFPTWMGSRR